MDFADEARTWASIYVSEKLPKNGDYILAYRGPSDEQHTQILGPLVSRLLSSKRPRSKPQ